jgi:predicted small secreted protein
MPFSSASEGTLRQTGFDARNRGLKSRVSRPDSAGLAGAAERQEMIMDKLIRMKAAALAGLVAISLLATACNTVEGAGKDTQNLGKDIQHSANENK